MCKKTPAFCPFQTLRRGPENQAEYFRKISSWGDRLDRLDNIKGRQISNYSFYFAIDGHGGRPLTGTP